MRRLLALGLLLVVAGFGLLFAGAAGQGSSSVGGVIFIGPFPIAFGSGPRGADVALASVVIGAVMVFLFLAWGWRIARGSQT